MDRRRFLLTSLAGAIAAPLVAGAQPVGKVRRIGYLTSGGCPPGVDLDLFDEGLRERGYVIGRTLVIECRHSEEGSEEQFRRFATELVRLNLDVIFAVSSTATRAVRPVTSTTPIVALDLETDPVGSGLAASLARPGGNITGVFLDAHELNGKWLQLLREVVPRLSLVAALWDATTDPTPLRAAETAAQTLSMKLQTIAIRSPQDVEAAFRTAARARAGAVLVMQSPMMYVHGKKIAEVAISERLPTLSMFQRFVEHGGLVSYGPDVRTAKALGLTIPPSLLARADQLIE